MATSRQVRRAAERNQAKRAKKGIGHSEPPTNQHGFACDRVGDRVIATFYAGEVAVTVDYSPIDARNIGELFVKAANDDGGTAQTPEIARSSGLVIASKVPGENP